MEDFPTYDASIYFEETIDGVDRLEVKSPKVLEKAGAHFGCSSMTYLEMEN